MHASNATPAGKGAYFALQSLKAALPGVIVIGIPTVDRVVIQGKKDGKPPYNLLVEGRGLLKVLSLFLRFAGQ